MALLPGKATADTLAKSYGVHVDTARPRERGTSSSTLTDEPASANSNIQLPFKNSSCRFPVGEDS
jgi:hypothetical protein